MNEKLTDITVVLDRSGSMGCVRDATIKAVNEFLESQKSGAGDAVMTLVQFDNKYEPNYEARPVKEAPPLTYESYQPRGATALLDAIGRTINATGKRLSDMPEDKRPGTVLFVIQTDGQENSSQEFTVQRINEMISHQRDAYKWDFVFLGANQDAIATAAGLGITRTSSLTYNASDMGTQAAFSSVAKSAHKLRSAKCSGNLSAKYETEESDRASAMA